MHSSKHFAEPEYGKQTDYNIVAKPSETIIEAERENLVISTKINSDISAIVSDLQLTRNKYSEDESVEIKFDIPQFKVEIKKKISPIINNDMSETKFDENYTKTQSRISSVQERADSAFHTSLLNNFEEDRFFVIDDGKGDTRINENESISLTNTKNEPAATSNKNIIYRKFRSFFFNVISK